MTALHWAAQKGDAELVAMLLAAGANVRATTRLGGYTPLHLASQAGHAHVVAALLAAGAVAPTQDGDGRHGADAGGALRRPSRRRRLSSRTAPTSTPRNRRTARRR